jgi:hypothetical protein
MAGDLPAHHARTPPDPGGDQLALQILRDPARDLLPVGIGQHPALTAHLLLLVDDVADDLHQDQLLRPVGIKGHWPAELVRDESLCLARLAVARCQLRQIEEACHTAQRAVERVKAAPSARAIHMLRLTASKLQPFKGTRGVAELIQAVAEVA